MKRIPLTECFFEGAVSLEQGDGWIKPWRLPFGTRRLFPPEGAVLVPAEMPAGVRLRFATASSRIGVAVLANTALDFCRFDLTIGGDLVEAAQLKAGEDVCWFEGLPSGDNVVEIWLPTECPTAVCGLLLDDDAEARVVADDRPRWTTYGSSITHCGGAHSPARTWPATAARLRGLDLTCMGYGGCCHLEPAVAMVIRDIPADFISLKVGINIQGGGTLNAHTFETGLIGMVRIIREKQPATPIAVISPIASPPRETEPGPAGLSLSHMRELLQDAVVRLKDCGDEHVEYFNGLDLLGNDLAEKYLPDDVHPDGDGYELIGRNFVEVVADAMLPA